MECVSGLSFVDDLEIIIEDLGVDISSQTTEHFLCYCPFHVNLNTPSFEIAKANGLWLCFNESCGARGNLEQLVQKLGGDSLSIGKTLAQVKANYKQNRDVNAEFQKIFFDKIDQVDWTEKVDSLVVNYDTEDINKLKYMLDRGFNPSTLRQFEVGFSSKKNRIVIPVRNESFKLVGVIGRAISEDKKPKYLYSDNLPKKGILFNLCHAKTYRQVIIVEGSLDAIKVHQAGYANVVASLGSGFSEQQAELINRYFLDVIIFGDNDDAGRGLGEQIVERCSRRNLFYAQYPEGIKDPGEMTEDQICTAIETKRNHLDVLFERFFK